MKPVPARRGRAPEAGRGTASAGASIADHRSGAVGRRSRLAPVLSVVGRSGSGKTTLVEAAVAVLAQRGLRVVAIKHTHKAIDADTPGKDSWRFREAGAVRTILAGLDWTMTQEPAGPLCAILSRERREADIVIVEGFSRDVLRPRIEVLAPGRGPYLPPAEVDAYLVRGTGPAVPLSRPWRPATTASLLSFIAELAPLRSLVEGSGQGDLPERPAGERP